MRKYEHYERLEVQEAADRRDYIDSALGDLAYIVDKSTIISLASDPSATSEHPAWAAIVAMGELALPFLLKRMQEAEGWWEIMAVEQILSDLDIRITIPEDHRGRIDPLRKDFIRFLRRSLRKDGRLKEAAEGDLPTLCACGKPGKWIADGICRTGYFCTQCSKKSLRNA